MDCVGRTVTDSDCGSYCDLKIKRARSKKKKTAIRKNRPGFFGRETRVPIERPRRNPKSCLRPVLSGRRRVVRYTVSQQTRTSNNRIGPKRPRFVRPFVPRPYLTYTVLHVLQVPDFQSALTGKSCNEGWPTEQEIMVSLGVYVFFLFFNLAAVFRLGCRW